MPCACVGPPTISRSNASAWVPARSSTLRRVTTTSSSSRPRAIASATRAVLPYIDSYTRKTSMAASLPQLRRYAVGPPRNGVERPANAGTNGPRARGRRTGQTAPVDDDQLLARAEQALTEIKVAQGLSEGHAAVLAAIRIHLHGSDSGTLEDMLAAAEDEPVPSLE